MSTETAKLEALKPCPFCGNANVEIVESQIAESAPLKRTIVVGRHDWDNVTTVNWANEISKADDLANWSSPPTHWLDGVTLPSLPEAE